MDRAEIVKILEDSIEEVMDEDVKVTDELTANEVDAWDSFNNVRLMSTLEDRFDITFTAEEIANLENCGALINYISGKLDG